MKTYVVQIREIHYSHRRVEANSIEEAKTLAADSEETFLEYSDTCDSDKWIVEEVKEESSVERN